MAPEREKIGTICGDDGEEKNFYFKLAPDDENCGAGFEIVCPDEIGFEGVPCRSRADATEKLSSMYGGNSNWQLEFDSEFLRNSVTPP